MNESEHIRALFNQLIAARLHPFPHAGLVMVTTEKGVYIIYNVNGDILHIGNTPKRAKGLRARLIDHMKSKSSFCRLYAVPNNIAVAGNCSYRFIVIPDGRDRMLLQALVIGELCPAHLDTREKKQE